MLHTFWLQCHCDLDRIAIRGIQESVSDRALRETPQQYTDMLRLRCLGSALQLAQVWSEVIALGLQDPIKDSSISGCAYQCAKIVTVLHTVIHKRDPLPKVSSIEAVDVCLKILRDLRPVYPLVEAVAQDIGRMHTYLCDINTGHADLSTHLQDTSSHSLMSRHSVLAHAQEGADSVDQDHVRSTQAEVSVDRAQSASDLRANHSQPTPYTVLSEDQANHHSIGGGTSVEFGHIAGLFEADPAWAQEPFDVNRQTEFNHPFPELSSTLLIERSETWR